MKIKKIRFGTRLCDLYGIDGYQPYIKEGKYYWYFFEDDTDIFHETKKHWNMLKVSYVRSGCLFYFFPDHPDVKEQFCPVNCFMASQFIVAELDPVKDLAEKMPFFNAETSPDKNLARKIYCFDDEHTIVKNWPNERETEVNEEEILGEAEYLLFKTLEIEQVMMTVEEAKETHACGGLGCSTGEPIETPQWTEPNQVLEKECRDCWHNYHCPMPQEGYDYNPDTCPYNPDNKK